LKFTPPLKQAKLIKRYKRFLADVTLPNQVQTTLHVANTGAMTGCAIPESIVWYSTSDNPKRKYPCSWELSTTPENHTICVNTIRANQLIEEALNKGVIKEITNFTSLQREVAYGREASKIDFKLSDENNIETFIEVKSVTLLDNGQGYFPDAKTTRGQKHLRELIEVVHSGHRAVLLFAVLHSGINSVKPAAHIDKMYAQLLSQAKANGVEIIAYKANFTLEETLSEIEVCIPVPVYID